MQIQGRVSHDRVEESEGSRQSGGGLEASEATVPRSVGEARQRVLPCLREQCEIWQLLSSLELSASQVAQACGVTTRQLTYWAKNGIIPSVDHHERGRTYTIESLRWAASVKQMVDSGFTLRKAAREACLIGGAVPDRYAPGGGETCSRVADARGGYGGSCQTMNRGFMEMGDRPTTMERPAVDGGSLEQIALHQRLDFIERKLADLERQLSLGFGSGN